MSNVLDLSWNSDDSTLYFGKMPMRMLEDDDEYRREVTKLLFYDLVAMQRELSDLRRWKKAAEEWIKSKPE